MTQESDREFYRGYIEGIEELANNLYTSELVGCQEVVICHVPRSLLAL